MKKFNIKELYLPVLALFIICFIVTFLLAITNKATLKNISLQGQQAAQSSRKMVLSSASNLEEKQSSENNFTYYIGLDDKRNIVGYIFLTKAKGYGGNIETMVGIDKNSVITGVEILSHNETPGLGSNIKNESFKNQFLQNVSDSNFSVVKNKSASKGEIEALTGATISSKAVTDAINQALEQYRIINQSAGGK